MSLYTQTPEEAHQSLYTQTPEEAHQIFEISYTHNTPLFILFYLPNCPYCKQVLPIWKQTTNHKNSNAQSEHPFLKLTEAHRHRGGPDAFRRVFVSPLEAS